MGVLRSTSPTTGGCINWPPAPLDVAANARAPRRSSRATATVRALLGGRAGRSEHFVERWLAGRTVKANDHGTATCAWRSTRCHEPITAREHALDAVRRTVANAAALRGSPAGRRILTLALFWEALAPPGTLQSFRPPDRPRRRAGRAAHPAGRHERLDGGAGGSGLHEIDHCRSTPRQAPTSYAGLYQPTAAPPPVTVDGRPAGDTLVLATIDVR
jgi:hypothetical protein